MIEYVITIYIHAATLDRKKEKRKKKTLGATLDQVVIGKIWDNYFRVLHVCRDVNVNEVVICVGVGFWFGAARFGRE